MNKAALFFRESGFARFFIPFGLILIIFGIIVFATSVKNSNYIKVDAVVSRVELVEEAHTDTDGNHVDAIYRVYVKYTVDGKEYDGELGELSGYRENDKLSIYYNPDDPSKITQTKSLVIPLIMIFGGAALLVSGIISSINVVKRYKKMKEQEKGWLNHE